MSERSSFYLLGILTGLIMMKFVLSIEAGLIILSISDVAITITCIIIAYVWSH